MAKNPRKSRLENLRFLGLEEIRKFPTATQTINGRFPANSWVVGAPPVSVVPASLRTGIPAIVVGLPTLAGFPIFVSNVPALAGIPTLLQESMQLMVPLESLCCWLWSKGILRSAILVASCHAGREFIETCSKKLSRVPKIATMALEKLMPQQWDSQRQAQSAMWSLMLGEANAKARLLRKLAKLLADRHWKWGVYLCVTAFVRVTLGWRMGG